MLGTGTQNDPYRPENWTDFLEVCNVSLNTYIKFVDNVQINFNHIYPDGISDTIPMKGHIDGNGAVLIDVQAAFPASNKNPVFSLVKGSEIKNITFQSVYLTNATALIHRVSAYSNDNTYFSDITVSGEFYNCNSVILVEEMSGNGGYTKFNRISGNIYVRNDGINFGIITDSNQYRVIIDSNFEVDIQAEAVSLGSTNSAQYSGGNYYTGIINATSINLNRGSVDIFNLSANVSANAANRTNSGNLSVYNSDRMSISSAVAGMAGCTEEQLHNAEYLHSIGFPIGVEP